MRSMGQNPTEVRHNFYIIYYIYALGTNSKKKHVIFSDIVTIAFDPHPPEAKSDMIN